MGQNKSKSKNSKPTGTLVQATSITNPKQSDTIENSPRQSEKLSNDTQATSSSQQRSPKSRNSKSHSPKRESKSYSAKPKRIQKLYKKYKELDEDYIGPNGIAALCQDLGVEPEDIVMLILAWYFKAQEMGYFTREEFINGLEKLNVDSIEKLKAKLPQLREDLTDPFKFKEIYRYAFNFMKEDEKSRTVDIPMAIQMLQLLLGEHKSEDGRVLVKRSPHVASFCTFLQQQTTYKVINNDQWMSFFEFCKTVSEDFSGYDENAAWPVLIDMYVAWAKEKRENAQGAPAETASNDDKNR